MTTPILDSFPFPFHLPMAQELVRIMASMYRTERDAIALVQQCGIDPLSVSPGLSPLNLWRELLEKAAISGSARELVTLARNEHSHSPTAPFLDALLNDRAAPVSAEPHNKGESPFIKGNDDITRREALLFRDDLTMATGRIPALMLTLKCIMSVVPSVCLLRVKNEFGEFFGTGFRIGTEHILTNYHVLFPRRQRVQEVWSDFGFDIDASGTASNVVTLLGSSDQIIGDDADDWAIVPVAGLHPTWPIVELAASSLPKPGDPTYIIQHPAGQRKRLGYVRNTISYVDDRVVHYMTDTQPGSSGAPVLDSYGHVIALHHAGGQPRQYGSDAPISKNEGIRISRVLQGLRSRGVLR